jgi:thiamine biosynthesis lipoprotein
MRSRKTELSALGGTVTIEASGEKADAAVDGARGSVRELQQRLSRFEPDSELCRLNADPRTTVPASPLMVRFAGTVALAGNLSQGLVDATCIDAVERAGYRRSLGPRPVANSVSTLASAAPAGPLRAAGPDPRGRWITVSSDPLTGTVTRPPGTRLDSGGTGKGLAADLAAEQLETLECFAVGCVGDIRFGGTAGIEREVEVASPEPGGDKVATIRSTFGAVATSGITRRSWVDPDGRVAHHLIDPATGRPAWTGVVQVTAIAPTGVEAEIRAKAALLSGPEAASAWLVHGGAIVLDDGSVKGVGAEVCVAKPASKR